MNILTQEVYSCFTECPEILYEMDSSVRTKPRHFAAVRSDVDPIIVYLHPDLKRQRPCIIRGVMIHEFGHIIDDLMEEGEVRDACRQMGYRYTKDEEMRADILGEWLSGYRIYYSKGLVQKAGPQVKGIWPRPTGLT